MKFFTNIKIDYSALVYKIFLILMIFAQIIFVFYEFQNGNCVFTVIHILIGGYFIFRFLIFIRLEKEAHDLGKNLIDYLTERKSKLK